MRMWNPKIFRDFLVIVVGVVISVGPVQQSVRRVQFWIRGQHALFPQLRGPVPSQISRIQ
jgi:hypothetical protein